MGKQLSPLEKEFLIKTYRAKIEVKELMSNVVD